MRRFAVVASCLFACACGDDGVRHTPDAAPHPDSPGPDAPPPPTMVDVTTLARLYEAVPPGTPHAGVLVFAVDPTGALAGTATTGADGKASVLLPDGGSVTVVYPAQSDLPTQVVTYAGVKPGDSLTFGDRLTSYQATTGQTGTMTISWAPVANATFYRLYSPCYASSSIAETTVTVDLAASCQTDTATVGLVAYDAAEQVLASVLVPAAPYTPGSTLTIAANQWVAQDPAASYAVTVTGIDAGATTADVAGVDELVPGELGPFWFSYPPRMYPADVANGTVTVSTPIASVAPHPSAAVKLYHGTHAGRHWLFKAGASPVTIDDGTLPWVDTVTVDTAMHTASWTLTAGSYDAMRLRIEWPSFDWIVVLPPGVTQLDASMAPPELAPYLPTQQDTISLLGCELVDLASTASYDEVRALPEWRVTGPEASVRAGDEPAASLADCGEGYHF